MKRESNCIRSEIYTKTFINWAVLLIHQVQNSKIDHHYPIAGEKFRLGLINLLRSKLATNPSRSLSSSLSSSSLISLTSTLTTIREVQLNAVGGRVVELSDTDLAVLLEVALHTPNLTCFDVRHVYKRSFISAFLLLTLVEHIPLNFLHLAQCNHLTADQLRMIISKYSHLTYLNLDYCNVNATLFEQIANSCSALQHLSLAHCEVTKDTENQTHRALLTLFQKCCGLLTITLAHAHSLTSDKVFDQIAFYCTQITELDLAYVQLSPASLGKLGKELNKLQSLSLASCSLDSAILSSTLSKHFKGLINLDLSSTTITKHFLIDLLSSTTALRSLLSSLSLSKFHPRHTSFAFHLFNLYI